MDKASSVSSIEGSLQTLKNTSLDTVVLFGTLGQYLFTLQLVATLFLEKIKDEQTPFTKNDGIAASQLNDLIRLSINAIQKLSSKTEMIDVIIKREKHQEVINNLDAQLINFLSLQQYSSLFSNKIKNNPIMKKYYEELDYSIALFTSYQMKSYLQKYSNEKYDEFNSSLTGLIDYLIQVRSKQLPKSLYWSIDGLQSTTVKEINLLFPDRRQDYQSSSVSAAKTTPEEEQNILMNQSFHTTSRGIWNGHFVAIQKVSSKTVFQQQEIGLRDCLSLLSNSIWKDCIYLIPLLGFSWENENIYFLYPLTIQRSLHDVFINANDNSKISLSVEQKLSILLDVCYGIQFLHSNGIPHGRLKDTNIFLDSGNYRARIGDFGYEPYLSLSTRLHCKGKHGMRWTAPEIAEFEQHLDELLQKSHSSTSIMSNADYQKLENLLIQSGSYPVFPSSDVYAIGILVLVLLTEKIPFFNVANEESVRGQLISRQSPYIAPNYPDCDILQPLLAEVYTPCTAAVDKRPTIDQLVGIMEQSYCDGIYRSYERDLQSHETDSGNVREEIDDLTNKIKEHTELVKKRT